MSFTLQNTLTVLLVLTTLGGGAFIWWQDKQHNEAVTALEGTIDEKNSELVLRESVINELSKQLEMTSEELNDTVDRLSGEKERNDEMEDQVRELAGTVSDLDKLSKTDKELLQKYSKVYFLNEHYIPESLREIDDEWKYSEDSEHQLHSKVLPFFEKMMEDALDDGVELWVTSAFRSFDYQSQIKDSYTITYGSGANAFSADQGFSVTPTWNYNRLHYPWSEWRPIWFPDYTRLPSGYWIMLTSMASHFPILKVIPTTSSSLGIGALWVKNLLRI